MGFNLVKKTEKISITIDTLTPQMIQDLIVFYAHDIEPRDVWMDNNVLGRTGIQINYPRIHETVVQQFYDQLNLLTNTVKDVVIGNYHTGPVVVTDDGYLADGSPASAEQIAAWQWGQTPETVQDLKYWVFFLVQRDFYEAGSWIYEFSEGHFEMIKPFIELCIDKMLEMTDDANGYYAIFVQSIKEEYQAPSFE